MTEAIKDLMPETADLTAERLTKLKELFPDLFTNEGKLNPHELEKLCANKDETERYEFRWFGKSKAKRDAFTPTRLTLDFDVSRSVNADKSENIIIEGENLEVLKLLLCGYREQIKCIYIDPPYNTGKDFVYSDKHAIEYKEYLDKTGASENGIKIDSNPETSGRYHSDWLSMMFSRLLLARQLLRKDGVIFISIDDHEVHNLRKLCDEVFGEDNFIANLIWQKKYSPQNDAKYFSMMHDHIICYAKNRDDEIGWQRNLLERTEEQNQRYSNPDNDTRGDWKSSDFSVKTYSADYDYEIVTPSGKIVNPPKGRCWQTSKTKYENLVKDNRIWFGKKGDSVPSLKKFLTEVKQGIVPSSILFRQDVGDNEESLKELKQLFDFVPFDTPKPTRLLKRILHLATGENDLVLDFFAGSGVTGQAVMELNAEDGGNRKFILVQIPELTDEKSEAAKAGYKRISDITIERNRRVVAREEEKMRTAKEEKKAKPPELFAEEKAESQKPKTEAQNLGFKVFRLEKSYFPRTEWSPVSADEQENIESLKAYIKEKEAQMSIEFESGKLLTEILLKEGFKLNYTAEKLPEFTANEVLKVSDGEKQAVVCLDTSLADETVNGLKTMIENKIIVIERALDTTKKWNLHNALGEKFKAF